MHQKTAELLAKTCDLRVYKNYSGRGMYGRETTGIVVSDRSDLLIAIAMFAEDLTKKPTEYAANDIDMCSFLDELANTSFDNLGGDYIVY